MVLLAPSSSPVLVSIHVPQMRSTSVINIGKSVGSMHSEKHQLRRYSEGTQVQSIDKETLKREAEDLDQTMLPGGDSWSQKHH